MDTRPIGVFDSGLGGLTALRELERLLPGEELIYFGDTGRVPYGSRSAETIIRYARQDMAFLRRFQPKAIVIACGTVSTTALDILRAENDLPIFGVVEPAVRAAASLSAGGNIGLIGTGATIRSGAYERALTRLLPRARVTARACPLFVPLVENGRYAPGDPVAELVAREYLADFQTAGTDTRFLGCTHYPLLRPVIAGVLGPGVQLVDVGVHCARWVADYLAGHQMLAGASSFGRCRYFVSDSTGDFGALASLFLGRDISGQVEYTDVSGL